MAKAFRFDRRSSPKLQAKLDRWWNEDSSARKRIDWLWFLYDLWKEGYHYARYSKSRQQIETTTTTDGRPKVTINKIQPTLRAIVNYALRNRPRAEVTPAGISRDGIKEIVRQNLFLDYLHDTLGLREIQRGAVEESLGSGIAWVQAIWDADADDGRGQIVINEIDKYDLYWQARARDPKESRRFTLAVARPVSQLKTDPKYKDADWDNVKVDNHRSSSSLKERLLRLETGDDAISSEKQEGTVLVKEFWYYGDKEMGEDPKKIYVCTTAGGQIIRYPEETDLDRMNFFRLCVARKKLSMVGKSWIKDLIPLNKRLNNLMSSLAEYNVVMNKVVMFADKGAGVRQFVNQYGVVYEKKRGYQITSASPGSPSPMLIQELQHILQLFEDISAVHDATMGRIPVGAKSGKALEALQVGDSNNLSEVVENTEIWLEELYEYILSLAATKYQFAREITPVSRTGQREFLKVVGEEASTASSGGFADSVPSGDDAPAFQPLVIKKRNVVDVKITSYLANSAEARREAVTDLAQLMLANQTPLDPQTILEAYEIGPIADIVERIKTQQEEKQAQALAQQQAQAQMNQAPQAGAQEAIAVIRSILNGQAPDLPQSVGPDFIAYFDQFLKSPEAGQLDQRMVSLLQKVRDQLVATQGQSTTNGVRTPQMSSRGGSSPSVPAGSSPS